MAKNIIIFSDGTGQVGGLRPDERRSNIYKLYRATRCGPDTDIDPAAQVTFYDAGSARCRRRARSSSCGPTAGCTTCSALRPGLGITTNIIECYCADPEHVGARGQNLSCSDSRRGAYTVRCLAAVLSMCGVPTTMADGKTPLRRDANSIKKIANEAVKKVYQHVSSPADEKYVDQRKAHRTPLPQEIQFGRRRRAQCQPLLHRRVRYRRVSRKLSAFGGHGQRRRRPRCCSQAGCCRCWRCRSGRG